MTVSKKRLVLPMGQCPVLTNAMSFLSQRLSFLISHFDEYVSPSEAQTGRCLAVRQDSAILRHDSFLDASFRRRPLPPGPPRSCQEYIKHR